MSVGAVSHYGQLAERAGLAWPEVEAMDEARLEARLMPRAAPVGRRLLPDFALVHQELKRKGVTPQLLWEEYVAAHPGETTYRYTRFCQRYADWAVTLQRSMRQVHRAGEKCFVDFAGQTMPILDLAGGIAQRAHIFVAVLGASNYTFACATVSESLADWLGAISLALEFYGGVSAMLVPDNPRALVAEVDRYEPLANRTALDFAAQYGTVILPARPYKPRDKALQGAQHPRPDRSGWRRSTPPAGSPPSAQGPARAAAALRTSRLRPAGRLAFASAVRFAARAGSPPLDAPRTAHADPRLSPPPSPGSASCVTTCRPSPDDP